MNNENLNIEIFGNNNSGNSDIDISENSTLDYIDLGERGRLSRKNKLNDLTGKEWIKFTKTWFVHRPPRRKDEEILHPAKYPESLVEEFIKFFTKKGGFIIDPFLGTGSTLVAARNLFRNAIGIEITKKYAEIARKRLSKLTLEFADEQILNEVIIGNSTEAYELTKKHHPEVVKNGFDFCITSPPYWNQLKKNNLRQANRKDKGLDTVYSFLPDDIGNEDDYKLFLKKQKIIFNEVYKLLKDKAYLVVITNNVFSDSKLFPLAFDTFNSLTTGKFAWIGKDEKIWCQDDKALHNLGINNAWVGNRCHQYCLIFRKELNSGRKKL